MTEATSPGKGPSTRLDWFCFDNIVTGVIAFLLVACPFAFGAVHQWAYTIVEIAVLSLVAAWLVLSITGSGGIEGKCSYRGAGFLVAAATGFLIVVGLQLVPMPLRMLRIVSPETYELYSIAASGPPEPLPRDSGSGSARTTSGDFVRLGILGAAAANRSTMTPSFNRSNSIAGLISGETSWRPISVAPSLTTYALVEGVVYTSLFLMVITYRFDLGIVGEARFVRVILVTMTACGALLAVIGIAEQAYWNGKLLWFFVPHDWGVAPDVSFPRASGPFVDPDHFANYLGMIFPLAAGGTLFGLPGNRPRQRDEGWLATRVLFGLASFVMLLAITLSFSRAIWLLTALGILALGSFRLYVLPSPASTAAPIRATPSCRSGLVAGFAI